MYYFTKKESNKIKVCDSSVRFNALAKPYLGTSPRERMQLGAFFSFVTVNPLFVGGTVNKLVQKYYNLCCNFKIMERISYVASSNFSIRNNIPASVGRKPPLSFLWVFCHHAGIYSARLSLIAIRPVSRIPWYRFLSSSLFFLDCFAGRELNYCEIFDIKQFI